MHNHCSSLIVNSFSTYKSAFAFALGIAGKLPIITFEEYIAIALDASRVVGIYPEIKNPVFINKHVRTLILYHLS